MGIDAIAVIRPKRLAALRGVLDPDRDSVVVLDDGTILLRTFVRFSGIACDPDQGRAVLTSYGQGLVDAHDDPRGVLFYPDVCEPKERTYDTLVAAVEAAGVWVPARILDDDEIAEREQASHQGVEGILAACAARERGDPIDPRFAELFDPPQRPSLEELKAQLAAIVARPGVLESIAAKMAVGCATLLLQRPSRHELPRPVSFDVNEQLVLPDGTFVVRTDVGGDTGMIAMALAEDASAWLDEHRDPRGVPCFRCTRLEQLADASSYEDVLARLGDEATFITPRSLQDERAAQQRRLREALDGGDDDR